MVNSLPIKTKGEIDPVFLALVEEGARAIHPDLTQFLVEIDKKIVVESLSYDGRLGEFKQSKATATVFQDGAKYSEYTGEMRRIRNWHPQRTLFHELIHIVNAKLGLSDSKEFIACYNADRELAKQNCTYETKFLVEAPYRNEAHHRNEVVSYCAEWQSIKGEAGKGWTEPSWDKPSRPVDIAADYQNTYPSCWDWVAKNAPSIDYGFANLAPRAPDAVSSPLSPVVRFLTSHTGDGLPPQQVSENTPSSVRMRTASLQLLTKASDAIGIMAATLSKPDGIKHTVTTIGAITLGNLALIATDKVMEAHGMPVSNTINTIAELAIGAITYKIGLAPAAEDVSRVSKSQTRREIYAKYGTGTPRTV